MADAIRFAKTAKGVEAIRERRYDLRGKLRTMLILIDGTRSTEQLRTQAAVLGAPSDFLETLVHDGYVAPVGPDAA